MLTPSLMLTKKNRAAQAISIWTALLILMFTGCQPSGPKSLMLGDKYVRQGEHQKALKFLARAAVFMPERPQVWNLQGLAYHGLQQPARAVESYQRALRIDRNFAPAHFNLGVLLLEQDRIADAINELNVYVNLQPSDDQGWSRLGSALVRARRADEADRALTQAIKLNPKNADAHNSMGLVHIQRKRPIEAMRSFNSALQFRPGFGAVLLNQAIVAQQYFGNKQVALERYKAYLGTKPPPKAAEAVLLAVRDIEQPAPALPNPIALADLTTNTGIGDLLRSNIAQQVERSRAEAAHLTNAVAQAAANLKTNLAAAAATVPVSKTSAPPPVVVSAPPVRRETSAPPVAATPATTVKTNLPAVLEKEIESVAPVQVVEVNKEPEFSAPRDSDAAVATGPEQQLAMNRTAAVEERPLIAPRKKADEEKHGILARIKQANPARWFDREEPRTVPIPAPKTIPPAEPTEVAPRIAPPPVRPPPIARYEYRKNLNLAKGNRAQAQKLFAQAASLHQQRRLPEAINMYRQAFNADPSYFEVCLNLGLAAYQNKDLPLALSANEQAVTLKADSVDARYNFAFTLRKARYYVDAANELRELLNTAPSDARAHLALANLYSQNLDEPALARTHYQRFLELAPNHPDAAAVRNLLVMSR